MDGQRRRHDLHNPFGPAAPAARRPGCACRPCRRAPRTRTRSVAIPRRRIPRLSPLPRRVSRARAATAARFEPRCACAPARPAFASPRARRSPRPPTARRSATGVRRGSSTPRHSASHSSRARPTPAPRRPAPRAPNRTAFRARSAARGRLARRDRAAQRRRTGSCCAMPTRHNRVSIAIPSSPSHSPRPARSATTIRAAPAAVARSVDPDTFVANASIGDACMMSSAWPLATLPRSSIRRIVGSDVKTREDVRERASELAGAHNGDIVHLWTIVVADMSKPAAAGKGRHRHRRIARHRSGDRAGARRRGRAGRNHGPE